MRSESLAAYQFMSVGSHQRDVFGGDVEINTVHYRTQFVVGSRKDTAVHATHQHVSRHSYLHRVAAQFLSLRIFVGILSH